MAPPLEINLKVGQLFVPEIKALVAAREFRELHNLLRTLSAIDLADSWGEFTEQEKIVIFRLLTDKDAVILFQELDTDEQLYLIERLDDQHLHELLTDIPTEETGRLFRRLPEKTIKLLNKYIHKDRQSSVAKLMTYPEQSVGQWMHLPRVDLHPHMTGSMALNRIQAAAQLRKGGSYDGYFVCDKDDRVVGYISLRELIASPSHTKLNDFMHPVHRIKLHPEQDQEEAIQLFTKYKLSMAPVVDENDKLLGFIQAGDLIPLIQKESTEDIQKLGGVEALDEPYFKIGFRKMIKKRGTWLCILFFGETLTASAMSHFEYEISKAVVLALFIPLIISSGGNSGSQAAMLVVRAMALKEISIKDWWRVIRREFASGLTLGTLLGCLGFGGIVLRSQFGLLFGEHYVLVGITVGLALLLVVLWGTLAGSVLPLILRRVGFDPAVASAPFVATLVDVTGLIIYFSTAAVVLKGTLL